MLNNNGKIFLKYLTGFCFLSLALLSCAAPLEHLAYMHDAENDSLYRHVPLPEDYTIRPSDLLYINISGDDQATMEFLNATSSGEGSGGNYLELLAYLVDENGTIHYPQLGELVVADKTIPEVRDMIRNRAEQYIEGSFVEVKLVNRTITILGEVRAPGQQPMLKNHFTIFEALGAAGDITESGNRRQVKIIRTTFTGKKVVTVDLTSSSLLTSDYYYIQPNDVIYVEPSRYRAYALKTLPWINQVSVGASIVTTFFLILNLFN
jgi:polysaccharide export outer membrane protein